MVRSAGRRSIRGSPRRPGKSGTLWAITAYFNPGGYRRRRSNYRIFRKHLKAPLVAVELSYKDRFDLRKGDAEILVQLRGGDILWQKERLLNVALSALPPNCSKVAWLDSDVVFGGDDWVEKTSRHLDEVPLLQPFSRAHYLPKGVASGEFSVDQAESTRLSITFAAASGIPVSSWLKKPAQGRDPPAVGLAWAARRDVLDWHGFYDACIVGGGDRALILAADGCFTELMNSQCMNEAQRRRYLAWAEPFHATVKAADNYVEGDVFHLWHGSSAARSYEDRHSRLRPFSFDPFADIAVSTHGAWRWSSDKPGLHAYLRDYFQSRQEDS